MDSRKIACIVAAGFISVTLVSAAASASAEPRGVTVVGQKFDPQLHRKVSYADLNLGLRPDQQILGQRISRTAWDLCSDLNGSGNSLVCASDAIRSTDGQFAEAIERAQRKMAGLPVGPAVAISMAIGAR